MAPRVPDKTQLGNQPDLSSTGRVATISQPSLQGIGDIGSGLRTLGAGATSIAADALQEQNVVDAVRSDAHKKKGMNDLSRELGQDPDYAGRIEKFDERAAKIDNEAAQLIRDPRLREKWSAQSALVTESYREGVRSGVQKLENEQKYVSFVDALDGHSSIYVNPASSEAQRKQARADMEAAIEAYKKVGLLSPKQEQTIREKWITGSVREAIQNLPAEQRSELTRPATSSDQVIDRIIGVESGGKPNAKNPGSSATGAGQFINETWLRLVKQQKPDLAQGRSDAQLLQLRNDPALSREMVKAYAAENGAALQRAGLEASPGNVYLAHFLGAEGAVRVLQANGDKPVNELLKPDAIKANPSILGGKTAGSVIAWANNKMGSGTPRATNGIDIADLPVTDGLKIYRQAENEITQKRVVDSAVRAEEVERALIDASAGKVELPDRALIEQDPRLSEPHRNTLLRQYDKAAGDVASWQAAWGKFANPQGGPFNPYDSDERKNVDTIYQHLGSSPQALQAVVDRTGILPKSAAVGLRGDLVSNNIERVATALTVASNLLTKNQNIFTGVDGKSDFENNAVAFRHYVDDLGMSAQEAATKIIRDQSPEYQAGVKARLKNEDIDEKIRKQLGIGDLAGNFDQIPWIPFTDPKVGFNPRARQEIFAQYAEVVKDRYQDHGDWNLAKKQAAQQVGSTWGVSRINGSSTVTQYPVERAPAYAGIDNVSQRIADHAIETVKTGTGFAPKREDIALMPIPGVTAQAYKAGQPVPYMLMWRDKDGNTQMLNPGQAFVADPLTMRQTVTGERQTAFEAERVAREPEQRHRDLRKLQAEASRFARAGREVPSDIADRIAQLQGRPSEISAVRGTPVADTPLSDMGIQ